MVKPVEDVALLLKTKRFYFNYILAGVNINRQLLNTKPLIVLIASR